MDFLPGLDPEQCEAVLSNERRLLVSAGPGSGKTRVLTCRFSRLMAEGVPPGALLAVTFTNRAAAEMRSRIRAMTGVDARSLNVETFHSYSLKLIRTLKPDVRVYGRAESRRVLAVLGVRSPDKAAARLSRLKNSQDPEAHEPDAEMLRAYCKKLESDGALDLDDLVPAASAAIEEKRVPCPEFLHIMVDEFQDINPPQARLVSALLNGPVSLMAIGDPDQAVYSFRGSSPESFIDFTSEHPGCRVINLKTNYRSIEGIVRASEAVIRNNPGRLPRSASVTSAEGEGGGVRLVECSDERREAAFIVGEIESMMGGLTSLTAAGPSTRSFSDFAVLFRTRRQADSLAEAFARSTIPFHVAGPVGDMAGFVEHLKTLEPGEGVELAEFIAATATAFGLGADAAAPLVSAAGAWQGMSAADSLPLLLDSAALMESEDNLDIKADRVNLMTLHTAKGLEFPVVFITGVEDGLVPLKMKRADAASDASEERRLFYVGMTRAMQELYLISAKTRMLRGTVEERAKSPFIDEIPNDLATKQGFVRKKARRRAVQKGLFD